MAGLAFTQKLQDLLFNEAVVVEAVRMDLLAAHPLEQAVRGEAVRGDLQLSLLKLLAQQELS
jgi:hypothetical protein